MKGYWKNVAKSVLAAIDLRVIFRIFVFVSFNSNNAVLQSPGPGCSKLTMSLVNVSLKFQTLISEIWQYFY